MPTAFSVLLILPVKTTHIILAESTLVGHPYHQRLIVHCFVGSAQLLPSLRNWEAFAMNYSRNIEATTVKRGFAFCLIYLIPRDFGFHCKQAAVDGLKRMTTRL